MKKVLDIVKSNLTFAIIYVAALVFYIIGITGDYITITRLFHTDHYTFINHLASPICLVYVILPIVFFAVCIALRIFTPKNLMKKQATVVAGVYIAFAIALCTFLLILFIILPDLCDENFTLIGDAANIKVDVYYFKYINFPYTSMIISFLLQILLGCYGAATCSE